MLEGGHRQLDMTRGIQQVHHLKGIAARVADRLMRHDWKVWFWGDSIGLEGLLDASDWLGDNKYEAFVYGLIKGWIARRDPPRTWDYTAPGYALLRLYEHAADSVLLRVAKAHAEYLLGFRRTDYGAYVRYEDADFDLQPEFLEGDSEKEIRSERRVAVSKGGPCVFVDNMHFDGPFFAKLYQVTGDESYRLLSLANILPQIKLLFDEERGLFHHFWIERLSRCNGVFWGRGQGWALLGIARVLENLPQNDASWPVLLDIFKRHSEALAKYQDESGCWHTVITDPSSYTESSIGAFVVDGFSRAISRGWLDHSYRQVVDLGFRALMQRITDDGKLSDVSYETYPSLDPAHYKLMPRGAIVPWGQGPLLASIRSYAELP